MTKILKLTGKVFPLIAILLMTFALSGCKKKLDYYDYVSENRSEIYIYKDDDVSLKVYFCDREQPYVSDGYRGELCSLCEVFLELKQNPENVSVSLCGQSGEMNYQAVENRYYLSFSAEAVHSDGKEVTVTYGGDSNVYCLNSVKQSSKVLTAREALKCALEFDAATFQNLTQNNLFNGEILIRLLYDDGCYYYVGVCDKDKNITAYLVDGESGKILAKKQLPAG